MATIAAAVIGAAGAYYASRQANKRSRQEREAADAVARNSATAGKYGEDFLGMSKGALGPVYDYYRNLATGDRQALSQYLSPEILAATQGQRRAFQTSSELSPRSGIATEATSRIPANNAAMISQLIAGARPAGIQGLATLGTNLGGLGMSGLGQGTAGAGAALGYEVGRRRDAQDAGAATGESLWNIFKLFQGNSAGGTGMSAIRSTDGGGGYVPGSIYSSFWKPSQFQTDPYGPRPTTGL